MGEVKRDNNACSVSTDDISSSSERTVDLYLDLTEYIFELGLDLEPDLELELELRFITGLSTA